MEKHLEKEQEELQAETDMLEQVLIIDGRKTPSPETRSEESADSSSALELVLAKLRK